MAKLKIYLDNCTYNRPFDDQNQIRISLEAQAKIYIQKLILNKEIDLTYSYMSVFENSENPNIEHRNSIKNFFRESTSYIGINKSDNIRISAEVFKKYNIKANDAIHLACAVEGKCQYFITTDDGILKNYNGSEIQVCNPINFISEVNNA